MAQLSELNFYEVLEVSADATLQEIERAHRIARATYQPNSLATYSLFSDAESSDILRRVEEAYAVLSDARMRREYDARLRRESTGDTAPPLREPPRRAPPAPEPPAASSWQPAPPQRTPHVELDEAVEPEDGVYDGTVLRRIRMSRGIELEEIAAVTKINERYLRCIEENRYGDLPSSVYVRGFLKQYARTLHLDVRRVADTYMARYDERGA